MNIHIIGVPEGEKREKGPEKTFEEIIAENFPNMEKEIINQIQEVPERINPRRNTLRHIVRPLGTPLGLVHWKRASSPVEAGTAGYL